MCFSEPRNSDNKKNGKKKLSSLKYTDYCIHRFETAVFNLTVLKTRWLEEFFDGRKIYRKKQKIVCMIQKVVAKLNNFF